MITVSLPEQDWIDDLAARYGPPPAGVGLVLWDLRGEPPRDDIAVVVPSYMSDRAPLARLVELPGARLVQLLTAGYEDAIQYLPEGVALANAAGVHDASTAELAVGLAIASLRRMPQYVRDQERGAWEPQFGDSLADRRVLLIGYGGVGQAVARRLAGFEADVTPVATRARAGVRGVAELPALLPDHDVVVLTVPLSDTTRQMVDAAFLAALPDGALVVNVSRGAVVDTAALLAEVSTGRLRAALDVVDPEPLPADHPLWRSPGVLLTPHVGGASSAFRPRALALLHDLLERLSRGEPPARVVVGQWRDG